MTTTRYVLLSVATAAGVIGLTFASTGSAQTYSVSCSTGTPTVSVNQTAVFTATGGNGSYTWSGQNLTLNNPTGSQFSVTYPSPGTYTITVSSGGVSSNCYLTVLGMGPSYPTYPAYPSMPNTGGGYGQE